MIKKRKRAAAEPRPSAGEHVAGIEDLILQILVRLPAKSLIRFKVVSKQWLSLISNPKFTQSHVLKNPRNPPSGMFVTNANSWKIGFFRLDDFGVSKNQESASRQAGPSLDFLDNVFNGYYGILQILESCNGLLLCRPRYIDSGSLCVCNPTTKQGRLLHQPTVGWTVSGIGFAFDPSISPYYKVICVKYQPCSVGILHIWTAWTFQVEVYSSQDHKWRLLVEFKESEKPTDTMYDGVFCDGGIHWLGQHSFHFDLNSERLVPRPKPRHPELDGYIVERGKYLYLTSNCKTKLYVFETSSDYREWVMKYLIHSSHLSSVYQEIVTIMKLNGRGYVNCDFCALGVVGRPKEEDTELLLAIIPYRIVSYNVMRNTVKTVYNFPTEPVFLRDICAFQFIETLCLV